VIVELPIVVAELWSTPPSTNIPESGLFAIAYRVSDPAPVPTGDRGGGREGERSEGKSGVLVK